MAGKKSRSIFRVLLFPLLGVLAGGLILMLAILLFGGIFRQLSHNMEDILQGQVENRGDYLLDGMVGSWSELEQLAEAVNLCVQKRLGTATLRELCSDSEAYTPMLNEVTQLLIDAMYSKKVSGAFVILTGPSEPQGEEATLPGLYLRDRDPTAQASQLLEDILVQRAPHGVVQAGPLSTDNHWKPLFSLEDSIEMDFFKPYYAALADGASLDAADYGYWTSVPYTLSGDKQTAISYSIPLILADGTVYGVLGVELLTEYVTSLLPVNELHSSGQGSYLLAVARDGSSTLEPVLLSGDGLAETLAEQPFSLSEDGAQVITGGSGYYAALLPLTLYSRNAPFEGDRWHLLGCVPDDLLYGFVDQLAQLCLIAATANLLVGVLAILLVSYQFSRPIRKLSQDVAQARREGQIPALPDIRILEIDQLVDAITQLSQEVLQSSTRFLSIMDMASVELAGFEANTDSETVYVTENYFPLLGMEDVDTKSLTFHEFARLRRHLMQTLEHTAEEDGSVLYTVPLEDGGVRYVRAEQKQLENRFIGLIEDVTSSALERKRAETERDHDPLTGLLSRQGFRHESHRLFRNREELKTAALLMIDLDKLKSVNDKFGHNAGDSYIIAAGSCFQKNIPGSALCARISGDEFLIFYHGYEDKAQIRQQVQRLYRQIHSITFLLPDGTNHGISATGGLAWYPDDSQEISELMKYSDFAMYCIKKQERGRVGEFDPAAYREMLLQNQRRQEFYQLLDQKQFNYHFQPIFDAKTGKPFAYEALMRPNTPTLHSPVEVLEIAKDADRMRDVETLTFFGASETYERLLGQNEVSPEALLFINSIADTSMTDADDWNYHERFRHLQKRVVIEITETETLDLGLVNKKRNVEGFSGMIALDDYGSGYNTELNLLELNPAFIKVDIAIVRNIHQDENKQQLMKNIVEYAHHRGMRIIAEGLEYPEEVEKSLELGVDLLQGYFLAKSAAVPPPISEEALALIRAYWSRP